MEEKKRTDVALLIVGHDRVRKALVDGLVLRPCAALVEVLSLGRVRDHVVKTRPEHLVAEFVVTTCELGVWYPDREAVTLFAHAPFHVPLQAFAESVCVSTECAYP